MSQRHCPTCGKRLTVAELVGGLCQRCGFSIDRRVQK